MLMLSLRPYLFRSPCLVDTACGSALEHEWVHLGLNCVTNGDATLVHSGAVTKLVLASTVTENVIVQAGTAQLSVSVVICCRSHCDAWRL